MAAGKDTIVSLFVFFFCTEVGDFVKEDEVIAEIETDKVSH